MPFLMIILLAVFGFGWFAHREQVRPPVPVAIVEQQTSPWARACEARLAGAAHDFEALAPGCAAGQVSSTRLPSGVDYVEYNLLTPDGGAYQVSITEEPDDGTVGPGWRGAPGCHGYAHRFEVYRHDHDRLGRVSADGSRGLEFARLFEAAANFCIENAH